MQQTEGWSVSPCGDPRDGKDIISFAGETVGAILWLRELRHPALSRGRMTDGLNAGVRLHGVDSRSSWTARPLDETGNLWMLLHNGAEIGELKWWTGFTGTFPHPTDGLLHGLNMLAGRHHAFAVEPMPLTRPHLTVVR